MSLERIAEGLRGCGFDATEEWPGYISVRLSDGRTASLGTANEYWGGGMTSETGEVIGSLHFPHQVHRGSTHVPFLVNMLAEVLRRA